MNNLQEFYRKIEYLRSNGVKMKEIADWIDIGSQHIVLPIYDRIAELFRGHQELPTGRSAGLGARPSE